MNFKNKNGPFDKKPEEIVSENPELIDTKIPIKTFKSITLIDDKQSNFSETKPVISSNDKDKSLFYNMQDDFIQSPKKEPAKKEQPKTKVPMFAFDDKDDDPLSKISTKKESKLAISKDSAANKGNSKIKFKFEEE